jgi:hypothetical protein
MTDTLWTSDFVLKGRNVQVKKTGAVVRIDRAIAADAAGFLGLYVTVSLKALATRWLAPGPRIWFTPDRPRPWYLVWAAAAWAGASVVADPSQADAAFYFDDTTRADPAPPTHACAFNFGCSDISKSRVAEVFESVFGYPLALDAAKADGLGVEKGEANGVHDGRLVWLPTRARPAKVYQKLVDNIDNGLAVDLRTPIVGGRPVVVFIKKRPAETRFANFNATVELAAPEDIYTPAEIGRLTAFARAMKLDWGGLDVLRDKPSGRIYIVDVNKTDMGPPTALPFLAKLKALSSLAAALRRLIQERTAT